MNHVEIAADRQLHPGAERAIREVEVVVMKRGKRLLIERRRLDDAAMTREEDAVQRLHVPDMPRRRREDRRLEKILLADVLPELPIHVRRPRPRPRRAGKQRRPGDARDVAALEMPEQPPAKIRGVDLDIVVAEDAHLAAALREPAPITLAHRVRIRNANDLVLIAAPAPAPAAAAPAEQPPIRRAHRRELRLVDAADDDRDHQWCSPSTGPTVRYPYFSPNFSYSAPSLSCDLSYHPPSASQSDRRITSCMQSTFCRTGGLPVSVSYQRGAAFELHDVQPHPLQPEHLDREDDDVVRVDHPPVRGKQPRLPGDLGGDPLERIRVENVVRVEVQDVLAARLANAHVAQAVAPVVEPLLRLANRHRHLQLRLKQRPVVITQDLEALERLRLQARDAAAEDRVRHRPLVVHDHDREHRRFIRRRWRAAAWAVTAASAASTGSIAVTKLAARAA